MDKSLIYFADPMCSWCWGFSPSISKLIKCYQQLDFTLVLGGLRAGNTQLMDEELKSYLLKTWHRVQEASGQPFNYDFSVPKGFVYDTEPACRAVKVVQYLASTHGLEYHALLQQEFYVNNQDITDRSVLARLANKLATSPEKFLHTFDSAKMKKMVYADFALAQRFGVTGFPCLIGHNKGDYTSISQGFQSYAQLEYALESWLSKS